MHPLYGSSNACSTPLSYSRMDDETSIQPPKKLKYEPLAPIPREACGSEPKQRPRNQHVPKLPANAYQEDNCYHSAEMARIWMAAWRLYKENIRMCRDAMFLQRILRISAKSRVFVQMVLEGHAFKYGF